MKICTVCNKEKYLDDFAWKIKSLGKKQSICRDCQKKASDSHYQDNKKYYIDKSARWRSENLLRSRLNRLTLRGFSREQSEDVLTRGLCEICGTTDRKLCVDHDHITGEIRGLLCSSCNVGLGYFRDSPELLTKAVQYLARVSVLSSKQ